MASPPHCSKSEYHLNELPMVLRNKNQIFKEIQNSTMLFSNFNPVNNWIKHNFHCDWIENGKSRLSKENSTNRKTSKRRSFYYTQILWMIYQNLIHNKSCIFQFDQLLSFWNHENQIRTTCFHGYHQKSFLIYWTTWTFQNIWFLFHLFVKGCFFSNFVQLFCQVWLFDIDIFFNTVGIFLFMI
jgi:hypothetical protein